MHPLTIPIGKTARRIEWRFLPPHIRRVIEENCGSPVVHAESQGAGFTPGFASVLVCEDGSRHFVKAAAAKAQRPFADAYREEIRKLSALPAAVPAPRLRWSHDADWVVLGIEYVDARPARRPWRPDELATCLDALESIAQVLTPAPDGLALSTVAEEHAELAGLWERVREVRPDLPHAAEAAELAAGFAEVSTGSTVAHADVRDDNCLFRTDGTVLFCDWNMPCVGASWFDTVLMLVGPRGDGLDVESLLAERPLTRDVPAEHIDRMLALLAGYFLKAADDPVPASSPYVRDVQRWQGQVVWDWLCERRGWSEREDADLGRHGGR